MWADERRRIPRVRYTVSIYELRRLDVEGTVRDITEHGVGVLGMKVEVGEVKTFIIPVEEIPEIDAVIFRAACKWTFTDEQDLRLSGFEITEISEENLGHLRKLIRFLMEG
jgi:hypothetical protein